MPRLLPLVVLSAVLVAGCSSSKRTTELQATCASRAWNGTVGTCLPTGWHVVDMRILEERGLPPELVAAYQADAALSDVYPTITVTRQVLGTAMTPEAFSEASVASVAVLPEYKQLDERSVTIDGQSVPIHVYSAKLRPDRPAQRYYQLSTVSGRSGFTLTGALPLSITTPLEQQVLLVLQNATFIEPVIGTTAEAE